MRKSACAGVLITVFLALAGCSETEKPNEQELLYSWLDQRALELIDDEHVLVAAEKYLAFLEAAELVEDRTRAPVDFTDGTEKNDVIDYEILKSQFPKWVRRHNDSVRFYNRESLRLDRSKLRGQAPPRRLWKFVPGNASLIVTEPHAAHFDQDSTSQGAPDPIPGEPAEGSQ